MPPQQREQANKDWAELRADVEASLGEDPAGPTGQALAARWEKLIEEFTGGDREILDGLNAMMADRTNWPAEAQAAARATPAAEDFFKKVVEAAKLKLTR